VGRQKADRRERRLMTSAAITTGLRDFEFGLDLILDGLAVLLAGVGKAPAKVRKKEQRGPISSSRSG